MKIEDQITKARESLEQARSRHTELAAQKGALVRERDGLQNTVENIQASIEGVQSKIRKREVVAGEYEKALLDLENRTGLRGIDPKDAVPVPCDQSMLFGPEHEYSALREQEKAGRVPPGTANQFFRKHLRPKETRAASRPSESSQTWGERIARGDA